MRRLFLDINHLAGWVEARDYDSACEAKYALGDEELWSQYLIALEQYEHAFRAIREVAKRAPISSEDLKQFETQD